MLQPSVSASDGEREQGGEGQVIFRFSLQQKQQQGASVPIEVSAPLGSALPPALLCGWAGLTTPCVNHSQTGWAGQRIRADEEERVLFDFLFLSPCCHQNIVSLCQCVMVTAYFFLASVSVCI